MRTLTAVLALFVIACGSPTEPEVEPPRIAANVSIDGVPGDSVRVERVFPDSLRATVTSDAGTPVQGVLVNFEADPEGCVSPDTNALQTNANGRVFFEVTAGTDAVTSIGPCTVRTVRSRDGRADVADSVDVTLMPGPAEGVGFEIGTAEPDTLFYKPDWGPKDRHGNPVAWRFSADSMVHAAGTDPWTDAAKKLVHNAVGETDVEVLHDGSVLCTVRILARSDGWVEHRAGDDCT